ncbi:cullin family domain-containing protein [Ditylenchus destructor]|nr:cullin family domain-containing protein [Ditylenchus destructor]
MQTKMRVRSFPAALDASYVEEVWQLLKNAITGILHKNNSDLSFEEMCRNVYTMVLRKHGEKLYNGLREVVMEHLQNNVRGTIVEAINGPFLQTLNRAWAEHTTAMGMIRDILVYLDRVYVPKQGVEPVYQMGLAIFREEIVNYPCINEYLKVTLLSMISLERQKEVIEWIELKTACQMLLSLGLDNRAYYEQQFEELFLRESAEFYRRASQKFLADNCASVYVHKVNDCLQDETQRAERYLDKKTEEKIIAVLNEELVMKHMATVVDMENSGLVYMLVNDRIADLRALYELLKRVDNGIKTMTDTMSKYLRGRGKLLVEESNAEPTDGTVAQGTPADKSIGFIQNLLDLKLQFDRYLSEAFKDDKEFKQKIQGDFEYFLNLNSRSPEYLSRYIDDKLKKGLKRMNMGEDENLASSTESIKDLARAMQRNQQQRPTQNKMRIRSFPAAMDASYVEEVWQLLKKAITAILCKNHSGLSREELYRNAYTMVLHKHGEKLYNGLREVVVEHLQNNVRRTIVDSIDENFFQELLCAWPEHSKAIFMIHSTITDALNWNFFMKLNRAWAEHTTAMVMIRDIVMYMDRVYVTQQGVEPVYEMGLAIFREEIVNYPCINEYLKMNMGQAEVVLDPVLFKLCSQ